MDTRPFSSFTCNSFHFFMILSIFFLSYSITFAEQVVISPDKINAPTFRTSTAICYGQNTDTHINLGFGTSVTGTSGEHNSGCTVGGGEHNTASGNSSTVGGGYKNTTSSWYATVGGGKENTADYYCTVGGGNSNAASYTNSTVAGGSNNTASGDNSTVAGGTHNTASGNNSTVAGGYFNTASGNGSTVAGGHWNEAGGDSSWAGGKNMQLTGASHHTFVWGYSAGHGPETIATANAFLIFPAGTAGKVGIGTPNPATTLHVTDNSTTNTAHIVNSASALFSQTVLKVGRTELSGGNIFAAVAGTNGDGTGGKVRMVVSTSGNVGIGETNPSYRLHVNGSVAGTSWNNISSRDFKKDIQQVSETAHPMMLTKLMDMKLTTYKYKEMYGGDGTTKLGFIAEDMPEDVLSKDGKGVDVYELLALTIGAMKAQQKKIAELETLNAKLTEVMRRLEALETNL